MIHNSGLILFRTGDSHRPKGASAPPRLERVDGRDLEFLVRRQPFISGFWGSLKALLERVKLPARSNTIRIFRTATTKPPRFRGLQFSGSFFVHCALIILLIYLPELLPATSMALDPLPPRTELIYYRVPHVDTKRTLPRVAQSGKGGRPGNGSQPSRVPTSSSKTSFGDMTIVSKPARPDNFHQTIIQPASAPNVIIPNDVKLPNIMIGKQSDFPKAQLDQSNAKPSQPHRQNATQAAPTVAPTNSPNPMMFLQATTAQPHLVVPTSAGVPSAPVRGSGGVPATENSSDVRSLLALGVDPSATGSQLGIPEGNRFGDFAISPAGAGPGAPGGNPGGAASGGNGGASNKSPGGDANSSGVGAGHEGGGGSGSNSIAGLSISGGGEGPGGSGSLGPGYLANLVFPVPVALLPRKNSLIVSAGPIGGGGLDVYQALHCGKIYTIFLAMPGKNWTLQYCEQGAQAPAPSNTGSPVIHLQAGIVPPDAESRFDFRRLPVPADKLGKMIVLKGVMQADGSIDDLQIYQGVVPQMDEAARLAFSQWKFKPAARAGTAVPLQILVGIPPEGGTQATP